MNGKGYWLVSKMAAIGNGGSRMFDLKRAGGRALLILLALAGFLDGCGRGSVGVEAEFPRPSVPDRAPVVLVPGVSREVAGVLRRGHLSLFSALTLRTDAEALANVGDPTFPAGGTSAMEAPTTLDRALRGTDVRGLQDLIDHLIREEGYVRGNPDDPRDKDYPENLLADREDRTRAASLFVVYFDWRRDLAESACVLAERIGRIRAATGAPRVRLVAHSYGGVVARYYLRYGGRDAVRDRDCPAAPGTMAATVNTPGGAGIDRLVLLGAPFRGSVLAFRSLLEDTSLFGFLPLGLRDAVFTMPLAWQLLPEAEPDGQVPIFVGNNGDERIPLYALRTWVERGWILGGGQDPDRLRFVEAMLARSLALQKRMAGRDPEEESVPRLVAAGECRPTPARAVSTESGVEFLARGRTEHPLFGRATAPGDGVVTSESATGLPTSPTLTVLTVCTGHNAYLQDLDLLTRTVRFLLG
jgi:pimeloyl-ACP methyl ester carboxylesterase